MSKHTQSICLLALFFMVMGACNSNTDNTAHKHSQTEEAMYYTCSMDPQVKEDKPGKCPICHMALTPIRKDDTKANEIKLSAQQIRLGNITTQSVVETQNNINQNFTGVLTANQENTHTIAARTAGRLEKLYFKTLGEYVAKNEAIYSLYSEEIAVAKQDYFTSSQQLEMPGDFGKNAKRLLNAIEQKLLFFGLSQKQIESIKTSKDISPFTTFYSNYSGTITEIMATEGSYIMEGNGIIKLTDLNSLWLDAQVNVNYASTIKIGQIASITFPDFYDKTVTAKVAFINPEINPDTRLLLIRLVVLNPTLQLKPGMQALVKLTLSNLKGLYIPIDALIREEKATYIWLEKTPGVFENQMVETGVETNGMIEIKTTLDSTKQIVITGAYAINSEFKFRKGNDPMEGMKM